MSGLLLNDLCDEFTGAGAEGGTERIVPRSEISVIQSGNAANDRQTVPRSWGASHTTYEK